MLNETKNQRSYPVEHPFGGPDRLTIIDVSRWKQSSFDCSVGPGLLSTKRDSLKINCLKIKRPSTPYWSLMSLVTYGFGSPVAVI
jgi:hypothetical protein